MYATLRGLIIYMRGKELTAMAEKTEKIVPISEKITLTVEEAVAYSNIGENKLRELIKQRDCNFVLVIGKKTLIKRKKFESYIDNHDVI